MGGGGVVEKVLLRTYWGWRKCYCAHIGMEKILLRTYWGGENVIMHILGVEKMLLCTYWSCVLTVTNEKLPDTRHLFVDMCHNL